MRSQIALRMNEDERDRLESYAAEKGCATLSEALRHALPRRIFPDPIKVGRPLGYSPKNHPKDPTTV